MSDDYIECAERALAIAHDTVAQNRELRASTRAQMAEAVAYRLELARATRASAQERAARLSEDRPPPSTPS